MNKHKLPKAPEARRPAGFSFDLAPKALQQWNPGLQAADTATSDNTISIFDPIGYDEWTGEGVTAKRIAAALRSIGDDQDVIVNINSPGGDVFEGLAIYNLLREHKGKVTVKVLGLAASAASFIAMAGDEIQIGRAAFFMIHNAWIVAIGNRNDLREAADWIEPFDKTIADIYAARTALAVDEIAAMMDAEKWVGGQEAVDLGFADGFLPSDEIAQADREPPQAHAIRHIDAALARSGMPRSERRKLIQAIKTSTQDAAGTGTPCATSQDTPSAAQNVFVATGAATRLTQNLLEITK